MTTKRLRVGAVNYLNTRPLIYGLRDSAPRIDLQLDLPSRLADGLRDGRYDIALIPSIEYAGDPAYEIVSNACIGCRGPVFSVKLFCRVPPAQITTLALDEGSRTSAALVQILLHERFGIRPQLQLLPLGHNMEDTTADAVLLIGDRAMHPPLASFTAVWDLGDEWCRHTELPFVFAMWVARAGLDLQGADVSLAAARDAGVRHLESIAASEAAPLGLSVPECLHYLRDNLYFYLGPRELTGLQRFYQRAASLGLIPEGVEVGFSPNCEPA